MSATQEKTRDVVAAFRAAAEANRQTPLRRGNLVVIEPGSADDVMITADVHGHRSNFTRLIELADLPRHPRRHLIMQEVCHGGPVYPSGGCMSHQLLEDVARLKNEFPERFHFLLSNHELSELTDFPIMKGQHVLNLQFRCGLKEMYGPQADEVHRAYGEFIASCPIGVRITGSGVLVSHSIPKEVPERGFDVGVFDRPLSESDWSCEGDVFRLVWGRDARPENADAFASAVGAKVLINGHEPCSYGYNVPNNRQVILDCCGENACYVILPVDRHLSQPQIIDRIEKLS